MSKSEGGATGQRALWEEPATRAPLGQVRRALDRDLRAAADRGEVFLETQVAALRRQANDLDRLERLLADGEGVKTWDYQPKTVATQAYFEAVRKLFGLEGEGDDPFVRAVEQLQRDEAARARAASDVDPTRREPPD